MTLAQIEETTVYIRQHIETLPEVGIILGTGLGALINEVDIEVSLEYNDIPNFPISTVESHHGKLVFGDLGGKRIVAMQGRFHYYEGYNMQEVTFPVRVMKMLGVKYLVVSNACGALNPAIKICDLMILTDHINLLPESPLRGHNPEWYGPRFPDMSQPYSRNLVSKAKQIADSNNIAVHTGTYVVVPGPNLETSAEYKYLRIIGGDVVGMSTVPEIIVANQMDMECFAISVVTDEGWHEILEPVTVEAVIAAAKKAEPNMTLIIKELISSL